MRYNYINVENDKVLVGVMKCKKICAQIVKYSAK